MPKDTKHSEGVQSISILPHRRRQPVPIRPSTPAGRFVAARFAVSPEIADVVAVLAGIGSEVRS